MKVFYEAVEKPTLETFEKTVSYWMPKSYKNIVKGSVAFFLLFSLFFLVFRGYSLAIICFVSAIFLVIEYRICKKRLIKKVLTVLKELHSTRTNYSLYFYDNKISTSKEPGAPSLSLEYSCLRRIVELEDLFVLVTATPLCISIDKNSLNPPDKYGWLNLICMNNEKIKVEGFK